MEPDDVSRFLRWLFVLTGGAILLGCSAIAGLLVVSKKPSYCGWCHVMEPYYNSWASTEYLAHKHNAASISCQDCHPRTLGQLTHEILATVRKSYNEPLPALKIGKDQCLSCHGDYASLAKVTASLKVNPHASHIGEEQCYQCHKMHRASPGLKFCTTCHHTGEFVACHGCHKDR
jgi:cytochrome c nitrite reductase small subunit